MLGVPAQSFRGQEVYPMVDGMATLVVYRDNSVDILEWSKDIPLKHGC